MFITFEGIEGCGKTTQVKRLVNRLVEHGIRFISTFEPGGTEIGLAIRKVLLDSRNMGMTPLAELALYEADRAQHVEEVIRPALDQGKWVICDRFFDATVIYQGVARGQDMELIMLLNDRVTGGIRPDITFLLDCPAEIGLARAVQRNKELSADDQGRFENEEADFHRIVRRGYLELADNDRKRFTVIDAVLPEDEVERHIYEVLEPLLPALTKG